MIGIMSEEAKPDFAEISADFEKAALNGFSKNSSTQKSRAAI